MQYRILDILLLVATSRPRPASGVPAYSGSARVFRTSTPIQQTAARA
jgi:hypothetical protein